jgi:hypothetical protein
MITDTLIEFKCSNNLIGSYENSWLSWWWWCVSRLRREIRFRTGRWNGLPRHERSARRKLLNSDAVDIQQSQSVVVRACLVVMVMVVVVLVVVLVVTHSARSATGGGVSVI